MLCFKPTARMRLGHVAVVSQVLTDRVVQITHANWSPIDGSRGKVEKDVTVIDVSPYGRLVPGEGLVRPQPRSGAGRPIPPTASSIHRRHRAWLMAASGMSKVQNGAIAVAQSAASQMAGAVRPGQGALSVLSQAADSTDRIAALIAAATGGGNSDTPANK